jgi:hypothetical protein
VEQRGVRRSDVKLCSVEVEAAGRCTSTVRRRKVQERAVTLHNVITQGSVAVRRVEQRGVRRSDVKLCAASKLRRRAQARAPGRADAAAQAQDPRRNERARASQRRASSLPAA